MNRSVKLWTPAAAMLAVSLVSYIDRNTLALLAPAILRENGLSAEQYGWIISAFSVTYMAANPLWGRWLDRWGLRWGMTAAAALWTIASASHAFVAGFLGFAIARAALGFGEGATFPGGLRTAVQTLPAHLRSRGAALAYSGGSLGAVLTPLIIRPVYEAWDWRGAFLFTGGVGALWVLIWLVLSRRDDLRVVPPRDPSPAPPEAGGPSWIDARLWGYMASYALGGLPLAFVLYHGPIYLDRGLHLTQSEIARVLWIPPLGWEVGYFLWGWLADRWGRAKDRLGGFRRLTWLALLLMLPLAATPWVSSYAGTLLLLFWGMFVAGGNVIVSIGYATRVFGPANAGLLAGLGAGSWSALVALAMPWFGRLMDQRRFAEAFGLATVLPVLGFCVWLWVNRSRDREGAVVSSPMSPNVR
jgi:MFS transporter, ACS family, hexuronate transporter